jgi:hypothetical protein
MKKLIQNAIKTPDGTILNGSSSSTSLTHFDSVSLEDYYLVGGLTEHKASINNKPHEGLILFNTDPFEIIRDKFLWGTYGKNGDEAFNWIILKDMTKTHIKAVLETQRIRVETQEVLKAELVFRNSKDF